MNHLLYVLFKYFKLRQKFTRLMVDLKMNILTFFCQGEDNSTKEKHEIIPHFALRARKPLLTSFFVKNKGKGVFFSYF